MKRWGYRSEGKCLLCGKEVCTLKHILNHCHVALAQGRFTWRHDSVLALIWACVQSAVDKHNASKTEALAQHGITFVKEGEKILPKQKRHQGISSLLGKAQDWKANCDLPNTNYVFPPHITPTSQRPDIILWSDSAKSVHLIELSVYGGCGPRGQNKKVPQVP